MKFRLVILFLLVIHTGALAQKFDIKLFDKTKGKTLGEADKNLKEFRKITKENKAFLKDQRKKYKAYKDSVRHLDASDSTLRIKKLQKQYFIYTNQWYDAEEIATWDSAQHQSQRALLNYAKDRLDGTHYYDQYMGRRNQILGYHSELKSYKDSLKTVEDDKDKREYLTILKKKELSEKYGKDLEAQAAKEAQARSNINFPTDNPELQNILKYPDMVKEATQISRPKVKGVNYFEGKEDLLKAAMNQSAALKKKYSKVVNSNDLSTATKRNSLEGTSFWERWVIGGTFQIHIDQQSSIDLNPELAYRINKKWDVGIGGSYRVKADLGDLLGAIREQKIFGYRVFTEYQLFKSFYGHLEFESLAAKPTDPNEDQTIKWNHSLLAGIERRFNLGDKLQAQISILYNFLAKDNPLYNSPWNIRFGFNLATEKK